MIERRDPGRRASGRRASGSGDVDSLGLLLRDLEEYPTPRHEEQLALARRAAEGDPAARQRMITANIRLVVHWARCYQHRGVDLADLVQEGVFGLIRAVDKFDAERGYRFSTYASWWIRQALQRAVMTQRTIRLPVEVAERQAAVETMTGILQGRLGRTPSFDELADALGTTPDHVDRVRRPARVTVSLDQAADAEGELTLGAVLGRSDEDGFEEVDDEQAYRPLRHAVDALPDLERRVLELRFGIAGDRPASLAETARRLGIGVQRVRSAEHQALAALRPVVTRVR
jgi:RNA polymerase primary sigma factor